MVEDILWPLTQQLEVYNVYKRIILCILCTQYSAPDRPYFIFITVCEIITPCSITDSKTEEKFPASKKK